MTIKCSNCKSETTVKRGWRYNRSGKKQKYFCLKCKRYGLKYNNNPIERYNGKLKDRLKIIRGGFGSFDYAENFMNLKYIIHNFVNPHQQLNGKIPAEMAGIKLNLGKMKLFGLIKFMSKNVRDD